jgi:hypothetical protein
MSRQGVGRKDELFVRCRIVPVRPVIVISVDDHLAFDRDRLLVVAPVKEHASAEPSDHRLTGVMQRGFGPDRGHAVGRLRLRVGFPERETFPQFQLGTAGEGQ